MNRVHCRDEKGAVLIHVAIGLLGLITFSALVVDYGVLWASRRQAQNAADASAHAAAVALAFDNASDFTDSGPAKQNAVVAGANNYVWGQPSGVTPADVTFPACPDGGSTCVRADVYRDVAHADALPTYFANLAGVPQQEIRATATAEVMAGNASNCVKPWAVIDRWFENWPQPVQPWSVGSKFDKYKQNGDLDPKVLNPDVYQPPTSTDPGSGFAPFNPDGTYAADYGLQLTLKAGNANQYNAGWFQALALGGTGGAVYSANIKGCSGITVAIGESLNFDVQTEQGNKVGPTDQAVYTDSDSLCNKDPNAYWDPSLNDGRGGVAVSSYAVSPRVVAIPLISPNDISTTKNGRTSVTVQNILGMFLECPPQVSPGQGEVIGRLVTAPGLKVGSSGSGVGPQSSFLKYIALVR